LLGDEIEWRSAPRQSPAPIKQLSNLAAPDATGLTLSRPVAYDAPLLVRAKNDQELIPRALPTGADSKVGGLPVVISADPQKPMPPANGDFTPPPPTTMPLPPSHGGAPVVVSSDDCCEGGACCLGGGFLASRLGEAFSCLKRWVHRDGMWCDSGC